MVRTVRFFAVCVGTILVVATAGCVNYITSLEGEATPALFGIVVAGADSVFLAVGNSGPGFATAPEPGARLVLTTPGGAVALTESPDADCGVPSSYTCYSADLLEAVPPGAVVGVSGTLASGMAVSGEARTPDTPKILVGGRTPEETVRTTSFAENPPTLDAGDGPARFVLAKSTLDASVWTPDGLRHCSLEVDFPHAGLDFRMLSASPGLVVEDPRCEGQQLSAWDSASATLTFLAYDENVAGWYSTRGGVPPEEVAWGVEGALGLFGAATPARFTLLVEPRR